MCIEVASVMYITISSYTFSVIQLVTSMADELKETKIKVELGSTRKYTTVSKPYDFEKFMTTVCSSPDMFGAQLVGHSDITAHYTDQDGDVCEICTNAHLHQAIDESGTRTLKVTIKCQSLPTLLKNKLNSIVISGLDQGKQPSPKVIEAIASKVSVTKETASGMSRDQLRAKFYNIPELKAINEHFNVLRRSLKEFKDNPQLQSAFTEEMLAEYTFSHNKMIIQSKDRVCWRIIRGHGTTANPVYSWCIFTISTPTDVPNGLLGLVASVLQVPFTILATVCSTVFAFTPTTKYIDSNYNCARSACDKLGIDAFQIESHCGSAWKSIIQRKGLLQIHGPPNNRKAVISVD